MKKHAPIRVKHLAFTLYPVKDMRRARRFYEGGLGLKMGKSFKGRWIEYYLGNGCFALAMAGKGFRAHAGGSMIAFEVADVDAATARLVARGAKVKMKPGSGSVCRMADLLDTEGNIFTLHAKHKTAR